MLKIFAAICFLASGHCTPERWDHTNIAFATQGECDAFLATLGAVSGVLRKGDVEFRFRCATES